ncbi:hypothetical protein [Sphingomonas melonis]|uniref:Uncharacterized protein n=1 Tax=Sphingomonas melonis TaxID=152682 RepID=A0A7Y9FQR2_9SPHN|nr:hypothetical protein [Sphingomonas melonis]NYD91452.1 hypothetical protein [Sphingomonas melonis]
MNVLSNRHIASANVLSVSLAMMHSFAPTIAEPRMLPITASTPENAGETHRSFSNVSMTGLAIRPLINRIQRFAKLDAGWDGSGSVRPTDQSIDTAVNFVKSIPASVTPPEVVAAGDGEISLFWRTDDTFVDISIGDGQASAFAHVNGVPMKVRSLAVLKDLPAIALQAIAGL